MSDSDESKMDEAYERGYEAGLRKSADRTALGLRYEYLKIGGKWQVDAQHSTRDYLAGFEDAMKTLGVKP